MTGKLTKNFCVSEFVRSSTASRSGILNIPGKKDQLNLKALCENILQPARDEFGPIRINSGYRCSMLNRFIGSTDASWHTKGCAADVEAYDEKVSNFMLLKWIHENCEYRELIGEFLNRNMPTAGWVHVAYVADKNIKTLKLKDPHHNYTRISIEDLGIKYK